MALSSKYLMRTLKLNMCGADICFMQGLLGIKSDGYFGNGTADSLKSFQSAAGTTADGVCGPATAALLVKNRKCSLVLSDSDYNAAAKKLGCDDEAIRAVVDVESGESGWIDNLLPDILFEGHIFWNRLEKARINPQKYLKGNSDILYPKWTSKYYAGGIKEYDRLNRAFNINATLALMSASYGMFQILGKNYSECGKSNVYDMIVAMNNSAKDNLDMFCNFIISKQCSKYLVNHDWKNFASIYNGKDYAKNKYDIKLQRAYNKHK